MNRTRLVTLAALFLAVPISAAAEIRITEIMYDAEGADGKREWVELFNDSASAVDISKWKFTDKSNHVLNAPPKNGGTGSLIIPAGGYLILASDAATFTGEYPSVNAVIDTVMSLANAEATISVGTAEASARASYTKSLGAAGTGESLQIAGSSWVHAKPTPGRSNATVSSVAAPKTPPAKKKSTTAAVTKNTVPAEVLDEEIPDVPVEDAVPAESQVAGAGMMIGWQWGLAASALAIGTGAIAAIITRTKRTEWDIEEVE